MIDRQKILDAKTNLDQLINGYNPLDSTPLADSDIVKNTHVHNNQYTRWQFGSLCFDQSSIL